MSGLRHLFVDDHIIAERDRVDLTLHQPTKHAANPVLRATYPWEGEGLAIYGTVMLTDDGRFRMWHRAQAGERRICYAESSDGVEWERLVLNVVSYEASTANSIIMDEPEQKLDGFAVIDDATEQDPSRRYKMMVHIGQGKFAVMTSADGIRWDGPINEPGSVYSGDAISMYYDSGLGKYVGLLKDHLPRDGTEPRPKGKRARRITYSDDLVSWTEPEWVLVPDANDPPTTELYSHVAFMYERLRIGYVGVYDNATELLATELCTSRDGLSWQRYRERVPFIPNGPPGSYDGGIALAFASGLVIRDERMWIYYMGADWAHNHRVPGGGDASPSGICLAQLRLDGFVSADAEGAGGTLLTKPLLCPGGELHVNADVPNGEIRAEVLGDDGLPIPGRDLASSVPFTGDATDAILRWPVAPPTPAGRRVRIRFHLRDAQLYSFWFSGP